MARHRTPTAIKEATGAFKNHAGRRQEGEPEPERGIGPAPDWMPGAKSKIWDEIVSICYNGVLGEGDRIAMEIITDLLYRYRLAPVDEPGLTGAELARLTGLLAEFGMTPASRSRVVVPKSKKENPFAALK